MKLNSMTETELLEAAEVGLTLRKYSIQMQIDTLKKRLGQQNGTAEQPKAKRTISAAGRRAIARAQRARWARVHAAQKSAGRTKKGK